MERAGKLLPRYTLADLGLIATTASTRAHNKFKGEQVGAWWSIKMRSRRTEPQSLTQSVTVTLVSSSDCPLVTSGGHTKWSLDSRTAIWALY